MISQYQQLHQAGFAHSIECWQNDKLVGGLYGVYSQGVFCGESMFSEKNDASKCCLLALAQNSKDLGVDIIDCQIQNPFLESMGVIEIPRSKFINFFSTSKERINLNNSTTLNIIL
jgi:leucyl/phenylalanyl-tRNA--protein transferase